MLTMDTQQIIQMLPSLSLENLQLLSKTVEDEMNPSFEKLEEWKNQKSDRKFEWVLHHTFGQESLSGLTYHAALVVFYDGKIDLYKGSSKIELFTKKIALRSALAKLVTSEVREDEGSDPDSVSVVSTDDSGEEFDDFESDDKKPNPKPGPGPMLKQILRDQNRRCKKVYDSDPDSDEERPKINPKKIERIISPKKVEQILRDQNRKCKKGAEGGYKLNSIMGSQSSQERDGVIKRYFDNSVFFGETPLQVAEEFLEKLDEMNTKHGVYTFSFLLQDCGKKRKFSFRGTIGKEGFKVVPCMVWDNEKKIYTDGKFVYTSLEKVYATLSDNGTLRPLTISEINDLTDRDMQYLHVTSTREIDNIRHQQYDSDISSEESSYSSSSEEDQEEDQHQCERILQGGRHCEEMAKRYIRYPDAKVMWFCGTDNFGCFTIKMSDLKKQERIGKERATPKSESSDDEELNLGDVHWCSKYKLYTDGKFVYSGDKKVFGKLDGHLKEVDPLDVADIRVLKEAKIDTVKNFHSNKIDLHIIDSRKHKKRKLELKSVLKLEEESSSSEADDDIYPEDLSSC